jgi:hypothetical protein
MSIKKIFFFVYLGLIVTSTSASYAVDINANFIVKTKVPQCQKYVDRVVDLNNKLMAKAKAGAGRVELAELESEIQNTINELKRCEKKTREKVVLDNITITIPGNSGSSTFTIPFGKKKR